MNHSPNNPTTEPNIASAKPDPDKSGIEQTLQALAKLSGPEYERRRKDEAKRLDMRVSALDSEVAKLKAKATADESNESRESVLKSKPWPEVVNGPHLLDELLATYRRFVVLPIPADALFAVWTLLTYVFDLFSFTPYLHVSSPEKSCGKSLLAELMQHLCCRATTPGSMSPAAIYRRIERVKPTLLLDKWDTLGKERREASLNALNTGFKWNGVYTMCVGDDHEDRDFHTFCPKAIFGLSQAKLPDTTRSRCFAIVLHKKLPHEKVERLTREFDGSTLRRKCQRWATDNRETLKKAKPSLPEELNDRQQDISEPLLAIADLCGGDWPALIRQSILFHCGQAKSEEGQSSHELLKDIREGFCKQTPSDRFSSENMCDYLNGLEDRPWTNWNSLLGIKPRDISKLLRAYGIASRNIKLPNNKVPKGYYLDDFQDAFARYLPAEGDSERYPATEPATIDDASLLRSATEMKCTGSQNAVSTNKDAADSAVEDGKAGYGQKLERHNAEN